MAIELISKIKPKNSGGFPLVEAADVELPDGTRLSGQPVIKTVSALPTDAAEHPDILYLVVEDEPGDGGET